MFVLLSGSAWAWEKYYWTGATSTDYHTAANWNSNRVGVATDIPHWRWGIEQHYENADIISYRIDIAQNAYGRGDWHINAGSETQPLEFYCTKGSIVVSPDSSQYNYASKLVVAESCDSWVWINGGQWDEFASAVTIGSSGYSAHLRIGNDRGVDTMFKTASDLTFNQGSISVSNATVNIAGKLLVGEIAGKLTRFDFYNSTMTIGNYFEVCNAATFDLCGGLVTNTARYLTIDDSGEVTVRGGGRYASQMMLLVGNYTTGTLNIVDGGEAASGEMLVLGYRSGSSGIVNIANGGILTVPYIYLKHDNASAKIALDGGTIRAAKDNERLIRSSDGLAVTVGENGGVIDAAGYNVTIEEDLDNASGAAGGMSFAGGGTVTLSGAINYTGGTTVEAGTVVVVPDVAAYAALGAIKVTGLAGSVCEVVRLSGEGTFSTSDLPENTEDTTFLVSPDGKSIIAINGMEGTYWIGVNGDLGMASNWSDGVIPTENPTIKWSSPITVTNSGGFSPNTLTIPDDSAVITLAGALTMNYLTNAYNLAIASTGSLTVTGDLVAYAARNTKPLLHSNYGSVTVGGRVCFRSSGTTKGDSTVMQYAVADENSSPIVANCLAYYADSWSDYLVANLGSMNNGVGKWVVGAGGLAIPYSRIIDRSGFRITGSQSVTLYSSANWILDESYRHQGRDLYLRDTGTLRIDTTDYNDRTTPRTVTIEGYLNAKGSAATPLRITGNGTVVMDAIPNNGHTNVVNGVIAVENGATLQINEDVVVVGTGKVSLAEGATLALDSSTLGAIGDTEFMSCIPGLVLPSEGTAAIRIDGPRLKYGKYKVAKVGTETVTNITLDEENSRQALGVRDWSFEVDESGMLVLDILPETFVIIVR